MRCADCDYVFYSHGHRKCGECSPTHYAHQGEGYITAAILFMMALAGFGLLMGWA